MTAGRWCKLSDSWDDEVCLANRGEKMSIVTLSRQIPRDLGLHAMICLGELLPREARELIFTFVGRRLCGYGVFTVA
jgi:hypothetical protein